VAWTEPRSRSGRRSCWRCWSSRGRGAARPAVPDAAARGPDGGVRLRPGAPRRPARPAATAGGGVLVGIATGVLLSWLGGRIAARRLSARGAELMHLLHLGPPPERHATAPAVELSGPRAATRNALWLVGILLVASQGLVPIGFNLLGVDPRSRSGLPPATSPATCGSRRRPVSSPSACSRSGRPCPSGSAPSRSLTICRPAQGGRAHPRPRRRRTDSMASRLSCPDVRRPCRGTRPARCCQGAGGGRS
jgi:hypothetical protein